MLPRLHPKLDASLSQRNSHFRRTGKKKIETAEDAASRNKVRLLDIFELSPARGGNTRASSSI